MGPLDAPQLPKNDVLAYKIKETYLKPVKIGDVKKWEHTKNVIVEEKSKKRCCTATPSQYGCMVQVIERVECILRMLISLDAHSPRLRKPLADYTTGINSTHR